MNLIAERENRHALDQRSERQTEPCWRILHLEQLAARLSPEERTWWDAWEGNSDYPNGLVHDETCTTCRGSGLQPVTVKVDWYSCQGCDLEGPLAIFETAGCRRFGAGFFDEIKAHHEAGEHDMCGTVQTGDGPRVPWRLDQRRCPLCTERLYQERAVVRALMLT